MIDEEDKDRIIYTLKLENDELKNEILKMNNLNLKLYLFLLELRNSFHKDDETYEEIDKKLKELGGVDAKN